MSEISGELSELERRPELAINKPAQIFYHWKPPVKTIDFSGDIRGMLGYSKSELARDWFKIIHPVDVAAVRAALQKLITHQEPFSRRYRVRRQDGSYIIIKHEAYAITDARDQTEHVIGFLTDISQAVRELQYLQEREKRYRELVESQQELIIRVDTTGRFTFINDAYCQKFNKTKFELIGSAFTLFVHHDDLPAILESMQSLEQPPYRVYFEHRALTAQGWRWIAWENFAIKNDQGETVEVQAIGRDITETKRAEEKLKARTRDLETTKAQLEEDRAKDEALLTSIGDGIIATDRAGKIIRVNKAAIEMLGFSESEMIDQDFSSVIQVEDSRGVPLPEGDRPNGQALQSGKKTIAATFYYRRRDGSRFPAEITVSPVIRNRKIIGAIEVFRDITRDMQIDLAKSEFVSLASHQLRTPLSTIAWYVEALKNKYLTSNQAAKHDQYLNEIDQATGRMVSLIDNFLNMSRIELGTMAVEPQMLDLQTVAESVLNELMPKIKEKDLRVQKNYDKNVPLLHLDPNHIRLVWQNLLTNAIKYTPVQGEIKLEVSWHQTYVLIKVADNGCGIPKDQQSKIFTKLFRADNVKGKDTDGTGLGLYIVKSILAQCQGEIWFESVENQGSTFFVKIPYPLVYAAN